MIPRRLQHLLLERLDQFPAVALLGPRQVGKTTLADRIAKNRPAIYLDLESPADRGKLSDPELYLSGHFVTETLINTAPDRTEPFFYRTAAGAEIDLLLQIPGQGLWAIEIKRSLAPNFHQARLDLKPDRSFAVYAGAERYPLHEDVEAISLTEMAAILASVG